MTGPEAIKNNVQSTEWRIPMMLPADANAQKAASSEQMFPSILTTNPLEAFQKELTPEQKEMFAKKKEEAEEKKVREQYLADLKQRRAKGSTPQLSAEAQKRVEEIMVQYRKENPVGWEALKKDYATAKKDGIMAALGDHIERNPITSAIAGGGVVVAAAVAALSAPVITAVGGGVALLSSCTKEIDNSTINVNVNTDKLAEALNNLNANLTKLNANMDILIDVNKNILQETKEINVNGKTIILNQEIINQTIKDVELKIDKGIEISNEQLNTMVATYMLLLNLDASITNQINNILKGQETNNEKLALIVELLASIDATTKAIYNDFMGGINTLIDINKDMLQENKEINVNGKKIILNQEIINNTLNAVNTNIQKGNEISDQQLEVMVAMYMQLCKLDDSINILINNILKGNETNNEKLTQIIKLLNSIDATTKSIYCELKNISANFKDFVSKYDNNQNKIFNVLTDINKEQKITNNNLNVMITQNNESNQNNEKLLKELQSFKCILNSILQSNNSGNKKLELIYNEIKAGNKDNAENFKNVLVQLGVLNDINQDLKDINITGNDIKNILNDQTEIMTDINLSQTLILEALKELCGKETEINISINNEVNVDVNVCVEVLNDIKCLCTEVEEVKNEKDCNKKTTKFNNLKNKCSILKTKAQNHYNKCCKK